MSALQIAHDIPGRLRLRFPASEPTETLPAALAAEPGVIGSTWSPRTRSLLVLYDPQQTNRDAIVEAVARSSGLDRPPHSADNGHALAQLEPGGAVALGVRELCTELDHRVQRATRGVVGLGGLLPVALTVWAFAEILRGRAAPLVWSSALWYAHGLFRDYQVPSARD
jgi:hypothetical protein